MDKAQELKLMVFASPVGQRDVAKHLGMDEGQLSAILGGKRPLPEGFEAKFLAGLQAAKDELKAQL